MNRMQVASVLLAATFGAVVCAQAQNIHRLGTANGRLLKYEPLERAGAEQMFVIERQREPTRADEQSIADYQSKQVCKGLHAALEGVVAADVKARFGIVVSEDDVTVKVREYTATHDLKADMENRIKHARMILQAVAEVRELGADPLTVYRTRLAPQGVSEVVWRANLSTARTAEGRAILAAPLALNIDMMRDGVRTLAKSTIEMEKANAVVDREISSVDETFRRYLDNWNRSRRPSPRGGIETTIPTSEFTYLRTAREEWWAARRAELPIVLDDPGLADRCAIRAAGYLGHSR